MAAGQSRRFGSDKRFALLSDGNSLLASTVARVRETFDHVWVVLQEGEQPCTFGLDSDMPVISVDQDSAGLGDSIASLFSKVAQDNRYTDVQGALIWLGDMPWVTVATSSRILTDAHPDRIVRPCYNGRPGHPVFFGRQFWPELALLKDREGARSVIAGNRSQCIEVAVSDRNVCVDVDTPTDLCQ